MWLVVPYWIVQLKKMGGAYTSGMMIGLMRFLGSVVSLSHVYFLKQL